MTVDSGYNNDNPEVENDVFFLSNIMYNMFWKMC